jgi:hypothetical protein
MSPSKKAFYEWWAEVHGGTPTKTEEACFQQGFEYAIQLGAQSNRRGSMVRGRVVTALRCLTKTELERENPKLSKDLIWPCLELDDGSIILARKTVGDGDEHGPAQLGGIRTVDGVTERVAHQVKDLGTFAVDPAVERAGSALERGLRDGERMQKGEATPDQVCKELEDDPL